MAHFAKVEDEIVTEVIVINNQDILDENGDEQESIGINFINNTLGLSGTWKQTSYNGNFRANYAGVGDTYDETNNVFIKKRPDGDNYILNETTWVWEKSSE